MQDGIGGILAEFQHGLEAFRASIQADPALESQVFEGSEEWANLLRYKLVPHLAGEGCLVVAIAGGTNTGKSTLFNLLLGRRVSPPVMTAAATRHPVLAANPYRAAQCLAGELVPEFDAQPLEDPEAAVSEAYDDNTLFVAEVDTLPDRMVLLDTPDVDSIERKNWAVADNIRATGDVILAVLTAEKYRDDRVVQFFQEAHNAGRVVIPVMNKANPARDYEVARKQIEEFSADVGIDPISFAVPHDFELEEKFDQPINPLSGADDLATYLDSLDVASIKEEVFRSTVEHFAERAENFLSDAEDVGGVLRKVVDEFENRADATAAKYDPEPGAEIGGLFHQYIQSRRGAVRRAIGNASTTFVRGVSSVGRSIRSGFRKRATLDAEDGLPTAEDVRELHFQQLERLTRDLATGYIESSRNYREPAAHLLEDSLDLVDIDTAVDEIARKTLRSESISDEFREHANRMLDTWWNDHAGKRRVLEGLDTILAFAPAAIAAPISIYMGGVGVSEAVVFVGPLAEQFVARVVEYQFGDAMFDFLSPWKKEQQEHFHEALQERLTGPALSSVREKLAIFESDEFNRLKELQQACLKACTTSSVD